MLFRGIGMYARSPRLILLGLVPALITALLVGGVLAVLVWYISDITEAATWWAGGWDADARRGAQLVVGIAVLGLAGLLAILTYTALTLAVGDPFYESISKQVEQRYGGVPGEVDVPWYRSLPSSLADSARLLLISAMVGIPLFAAGFIPVVGQTVVPVIGALVGGWFLAVELVGVPFQRRGLRLADRRRVLRGNRPLAIGFGAAVFVCFLIPFGAVLVMPAAVAGASLLARRALGLPHH